MTFRERTLRWSAILSAGVVGGTSSLTSWWASLPPELRSLLVAALVGLCGELWQIVKAAARARAARMLGVPATPAEAPAGGPFPPDALERAAFERAALERTESEGRDVHKG